jgi:hypothetical protein
MAGLLPLLGRGLTPLPLGGLTPLLLLRRGLASGARGLVTNPSLASFSLGVREERGVTTLKSQSSPSLSSRGVVALFSLLPFRGGLLMRRGCPLRFLVVSDSSSFSSFGFSPPSVTLHLGVVAVSVSQSASLPSRVRGVFRFFLVLLSFLLLPASFLLSPPFPPEVDCLGSTSANNVGACAPCTSCSTGAPGSRCPRCLVATDSGSLTILFRTAPVA